MKTAVITDLHANREAVSAVFEHAAAQGVHSHALLGDFVGYGADPAWVVDRVREQVRAGAIAVLGNHDEAVVRGAASNMRPEPRHVVDWTRGQLDASQLDFLASLPLHHERGDQLFVHANAWEPAAWAYVHGRDEAARSLAATAQRITFCGHMHEPQLYHVAATGKVATFVPTPAVAIPLLAQRRWLVIPGSAGQPRDGDPAACYAIYDDEAGTLTFWRVPYDHEAAAAKMRAARLPLRLAERLAHGV
ncbi:MAG: metallophosphoesterase family protein [Rubrivivax sp.]|nr:metallophosphoesterase family protein [Rubrivivax sp.]MDP3084718.1 metallophosphoesterase family protein [Rubrivivax sp.]